MSSTDSDDLKNVSTPRNIPRPMRASGRVRVIRPTTNREYGLDQDNQPPQEILRIYSKLRELDARESSELCKAIDYSLKIFGYANDASSTLQKYVSNLSHKSMNRIYDNG